MSQTERQKRLRLLLKKLNKQRKQQASQIDILCNDLIGAQRSFIQRLQDLGFAAEFYQSLLGGTDLDSLLARAARVLRQELPGTGVAFFLRHGDACEFHPCRDDEALYGAQAGPEDSLDPELVDHLCKYNRPCTLEEIADPSWACDWETLSRFSLVTLPLTDLGRSLGFVLVYCPRPQALTVAEVRRIAPALHGLARAIRAVHTPGPAARKNSTWDPTLP
jgi:hypothetical protein